jgi:hypothetical protein
VQWLLAAEAGHFKEQVDKIHELNLFSLFVHKVMFFDVIWYKFASGMTLEESKCSP